MSEFELANFTKTMLRFRIAISVFMPDGPGRGATFGETQLEVIGNRSDEDVVLLILDYLADQLTVVGRHTT